jgi:hypothetical protein
LINRDAGLPMFGVENDGSALDTVAHIIQVALTPVFLLSGIATLLNVFSTRLARVADRVEAASNALADADPAEARRLAGDLAHLRRRSIVLDVAVVLGAIGGAATCGAVLTLFVGSLRDAAIASILFALFGLAVICALGAIAAFTIEMLLAGTGIRAEVAHRRHAVGEDAAESADPPENADASAHAAAAEC